MLADRLSLFVALYLDGTIKPISFFFFRELLPPSGFHPLQLLENDLKVVKFQSAHVQLEYHYHLPFVNT